MTRFIAPLLFVLLFGCQSKTTEDLAKDTERIDAFFEEMYNKKEFNGAVLVAEGGQVIFKKAYGIGDIHSNSKFTTSTPSNSASVGKQFVAMSIMVLKEQNKLNYDDRVNQHLKSFPYDTITVRHLLTHTSGLADYIDLAYAHLDSTQLLTNEKVAALFIDHRPQLRFVPGSRFEYSNTGYLYLAMIVEAVSGTDLAKFTKQNIFEPAGMTTASVYALSIGIFPNGGARGFVEVEGEPTLHDLTWMDGVYGDGNFYFSVEDLYQWHLALKENKIVSAKTFKDAITPNTLNNGKKHPYGFGWFVGENGEMWHTGSWVAFYNLIYRDMNKNRVIITMDNHGMGKNSSLGTSLINLLEGREANFPFKESMQLATANDHRKILGNYRSETSGDTITIKENNTNISFVVGSRQQPLYFQGDNRYYVPMWDQTLSFTEERGVVTAMNNTGLTKSSAIRIQ